MCGTFFSLDNGRNPPPWIDIGKKVARYCDRKFLFSSYKFVLQLEVSINLISLQQVVFTSPRLGKSGAAREYRSDLGLEENQEMSAP